MSPWRLSTFLADRKHLLARGASLLLLAAMGGWLVSAYLRISRQPSAMEAVAATPPAWPEPADIETHLWDVFQKKTSGAQVQAGPLAQRYRLAGTFFAFGHSPEDGGGGRRSAILDDLQKNAQHLLREGEQVDGVEVAHVYPDRVILRGDGLEEELWLSFSDGTATPSASGKAGDATPQETVLETNRFGKRVGPARWVLGRDVLMGYYHELLDNPERLASLYLSMKPDYNASDIEGYYLDMEGEQDFFRAVGLLNGDVVRRVNSMKMISQTRAEYFIKEFVKGRVGAIVLDIERGGKAEKLVYLIR